MQKVILFTFLLIIGLVFSQLLNFFPENQKIILQEIIQNLTLIFLAYIMIHVGLEFTIDHSKLRSYEWDYVVAFTAATFPWIFCTFYFFYFFQHNPAFSKMDIFIDCLLLGRFASPTSAGVLFTMLAAAGLEHTWVFQKARILAIFDDLDTIILLVPIKMMIIGFRIELILLLLIIAGLIYLAWTKMRSIKLPINWYWVLGYSIILTIICEVIYLGTKALEGVLPLHIEILLPAFVFGSILAYPKGDFHESIEIKANLIISAFFMFLVGASMPTINKQALAGMSGERMLFDVIILTILSNLGKMFPLFCYRAEATIKERLALSIAMCPRGEVGAGVIVISLSLIKFLDKNLIIIAMLSLALNLLLTGPFIIMIKRLLSDHGKSGSVNKIT